MSLHVYPGTPFSIEVHGIDNGKGYWSSNKIIVRRDGNPIGEYVRQYPNFTAATFHPFKLGDDWYALYSADYTATRVAKLTETEFIDWCGEESSSMGFCPTEFFVPMCMKYTYTMKRQEEDKELTITSWFDSEYENAEEFLKDVEEHKATIHWMDFGFLSGCYWGDDSSWKLRHIDLNGIPDKKLIITEKFGYWELPHAIRKSMRIFSATHIQLTGSFTMDMRKDIPNDSFRSDFFTYQTSEV